MATPEIVMGSSLLALFVNAGFAGILGFWTIFIAHVLFCLSFVVVTVKARLAGLDPRLEEAAMDLYADQWQTFWRVSFPLVFPGILPRRCCRSRCPSTTSSSRTKGRGVRRGGGGRDPLQRKTRETESIFLGGGGGRPDRS